MSLHESSVVVVSMISLMGYLDNHGKFHYSYTATPL